MFHVINIQQTKELVLLLFPSQERLSYIGPEEFVQAFVRKDPLDNNKVTPAFLCKDKFAR